MPTETLSLTELRPRLSAIVDRVHQALDRVVITRHGQAEAVLLSAADFEGLLETLDVLSDGELVGRLVAAEDEFARGGGHTLAEVRRGRRLNLMLAATDRRPTPQCR